MARLEFDFHTAPARPNMIGIALALAGMLALVWSVDAWQAARDAEAGLERQIAALQKVRPAAAPRRAADGDTMHAAQARMTARLAWRWQPAFDALAAAHDKTIALIALDGEQAKSQLRLTAEARTLVHAVAWIERLQQQAGVRRATLVQHEVQTDALERPVRFIVSVELAS